MIGTYQTIPSEVIIPLGRDFNGAHLIMPGQIRAATVDITHEKYGGDVPTVPMRPVLNRTAIVALNETDPQPAQINMADFFKGGVYHG